MKGKIVIDANNAWEGRDGPDAIEAKSTGEGTGIWTASILSDTRVVKAFNTWPFFRMRLNPGDPNQPAVPVAADDEEAARIGMQLVNDAGLEGILLPGGLGASRLFDTGTPIGPNSGLTKSEILGFLGWV
jgi:predicted dinucleotide-binding enzyme